MNDTDYRIHIDPYITVLLDSNACTCTLAGSNTLVTANTLVIGIH